MSSIPYLGTNGFRGVHKVVAIPAVSSTNQFWKYLILSGIVVGGIVFILYMLNAFSTKSPKANRATRVNNSDIEPNIQTYSEVDENGNMKTWTYPKGQYDTVEDIKKFGKLYVQKRNS